MTSTRLLVIEDEAPIRKFLRAALVDADYTLDEAETGTQGLRLAASSPPDAVILDLGLPDLDGLEVLKRLRDWYASPIIVLSARGQERDKVQALDLGADDYLTKPFGIGELLARIRVALRHVTRNSSPAGSVYEQGDLRVDFEARRVTRASVEIHLTPIEYRLLTTLIKHSGKVLTHRFLLKEVWGPENVYETHYLRVFMATLRRKLEADSARPVYLLTEPGVGYRFADA
ncbi:MAG: response regulator [Planctomycetota bacterium]|jgi:two-component system KDP operon response regulator KdpE